jgi:fluoroacetyl-CoA thioesterase
MYNTSPPRPLGHEVCATAEVINVEGKRVDFKVSASDGIEEIGSGTHQRIVIDLCRSMSALLKRGATN